MKIKDIVLIIGNIIFWIIASYALLNIMADMANMVSIIAEVVSK